MNSVIKKTPEKEELDRKQSELAFLQTKLARNELNLATLKAELHLFEMEFLRTVGVKYAELDRLEAMIADYFAHQNPENPQFKEKSREANRKAEESSEATSEAAESQDNRKDFRPSENLKELYSEVAKLIHPDLTTDENERAKRHKLMTEANKAYQDGDKERLLQILHQWISSPEFVQGEGVAADLVRVIRMISQAWERLVKIKEQIEVIKISDLYRLRMKVIQAKEYSRDVLSEMVTAVDMQVIAAKKRYNDLIVDGGNRYD